MTKNFDNLNDAFNTSGEIINPEVQSPDEKIEKIKSSVDDIKKDYDYTRGNLYSIIEKGQEALNGVLELARLPLQLNLVAVVIEALEHLGDHLTRHVDLLGDNINTVLDVADITRESFNTMPGNDDVLLLPLIQRSRLKKMLQLFQGSCVIRKALLPADISSQITQAHP